jgi:hypothetical protein
MWRIRAYRSAASVAGAAEAWLKSGGGIFEGTEEEARAYAAELNASLTTPNVRYVATKFEDDDGEG